MSKDTTGTRRCERGTVPGIPKVVSRHVNVMLSVKAVCQGNYQCLGIRPLSSEEKYLIICMETPTKCITFMLLGAACCHAEQHISRSGHASRPHQTLAAGSQQSAVDGWHQQQIWHMIQLENVEAVMRSSAGGRMTADDERRQQLMQHAAREKQCIPTMYLVHARYVQQHCCVMYLFRTSTYQRQEQWRVIVVACSSFRVFFLNIS